MGVTHILEQLVSFRTLPEHPNVELLDYVTEYLRTSGIESVRIMEPDGTRGSLVAVVGPARPGGIVLSAHSDVVSVDGQTWTMPPWKVTAERDRLYGRGTADMKGFIACCLDAAARIDVARLERPLILAISHDEEIGCKGAPLLIRHITANLPQPRAVIVGEPTAMKVVHGHKGVAVYETRVYGAAGHSSMPQIASSATHASARLIAHIDDIMEHRSRRSDAGGFDPPYTTLNVGIVRGGEASNIVAAECMFRWDVRPVPGEDARSILQEVDHYAATHVLPGMLLRAPNAAIETRMFASAPALSPRGDPAAREIALRASKTSDTRVVSFATEAGLFQAAGMSAVVCGPGSIEQAHKPDEFVEMTQLQACSVFIRHLVGELSSSAPGTVDT